MTSKNLRIAELASFVNDNGTLIAAATPDLGTGIELYDSADLLPLSGNAIGDQAFVESTNRLYLWDSGWYSIALINTNPSITGGVESSYVFETDGTPIVVTAVGSDPEGIPLTWSYAVTSGTLGDTAVITQDENEFTLTPSTDTEDVGTFEVTFTASDGVNIGTAAASFTLVFLVVNSRYTSLLLKAAGDAGVNTSFIDNSSNGSSITAYGDVYQTSLSPYRPGGYSNYFDGSGDQLLVPNDASNQLSGSNFTIECWVYFNSLSSEARFINKNPASTFGYILGAVSSKLYFKTDNTTITGTTTLSIGQWYHFAVTNDGTTTKIFVNGTLDGSATGVTITNENVDLSIGSRLYLAGLGLIGYMSDVRMVKGTALYTSNFTPPTEPLTAISGTSVLTCNTSTITDQSSNNFAIIKNGDTKVIPWSVYDHTPAYISGSAYFDGSGDYLQTTSYLPELNPSSGDFTIEFWVYAGSSARQDWVNLQASSGFNRILVYYNSGTIQYVAGSTGAASTRISQAVSSSQLLNTWHHIALSRESGSSKLFLDGVQIGSTYADSHVWTNDLQLTAFRDPNGSTYATGYISDLRIVKGTAVYTSDFTPPTEPLTDITNTSLLLKFDNGKVYDLLQSNSLTLVGDAKSSTTQAKFASTSSVSFDGTGDYLTSLSANVLPVSNESYTIECWAYITNLSTRAHFAFWGAASSNQSNGFRVNTAGNGLLAYWYANDLDTGNIGLLVNTWYHVATSFDGTTRRIFLDGVLKASDTPTGHNVPSTSDLIIGTNSTKNGEYMNGYIQDLRITKGLARYTANFTPSTTPLAG